MYEEMKLEGQKEEVELNEEQVARIDEIHNAVMELCEIMCEDELEWDMAFIGEIADAAAEILTEQGKKVRYPAVVTNADGSQYIAEYYDE